MKFNISLLLVHPFSHVNIDMSTFWFIKYVYLCVSGLFDILVVRKGTGVNPFFLTDKFVTHLPIANKKVC